MFFEERRRVQSSGEAQIWSKGPGLCKEQGPGLIHMSQSSSYRQREDVIGEFMLYLWFSSG